MLKPGFHWIDCPQDRAAVKEIVGRGRITAKQLAETLRDVLSYVVTVAVDCCGVRCNEPCCLTCFGEEKAEKEAGLADDQWRASHEVLRQWREEQS
jgi:hypothetical protein